MSLPVTFLPSPNEGKRPDGVPIDMLILHYTGMQSAKAAIDRLRDREAAVSSHYVLDEDGSAFALVDEKRRAQHAGVSHWRGHEGLNDRSIGIEIVNPGHEWGYRAFPEAQLAALETLCLDILGRHPIPARNVVGHSDVAPDRKQDPGELFPWGRLAARGIGLWPDRVAGAEALTPVDEERLGSMPRMLARVGYAVAPAGPALETVLTAFQRHWRPSNVMGIPDEGTWRVLEAVAALGD